MNRLLNLRLLKPLFSTGLSRSLALLVALAFLLNACNIPQVKAEDRLFLDLSIDFLGSYQLPKLTFQDTPVGGLSGITYDRQRDRFYAISDDRSERAPARFYTLKLTLQPTSQPTENSSTPNMISSDDSLAIAVEIGKVTTLTGEDGQPYARGTVDLEGIAPSPRQSLFISSEGVAREGIAPFINEFDLETGRWLSRLPIPQRFLPEAGQSVGVQDNLGFEALTLNANGSVDGRLEPFRVFAATESALQQDLPNSQSVNLAPSSSPPNSPSSPASSPLQPTPVRFLHYLVGDNQTTLLAEHLYLVEPVTGGTTQGLTDLLTLDQGGHFLSLERSFGALTGFGAQLFQIATSPATDISGVSSLKGDISGITAIYKRSLLNLQTLGISLDNLEGMTLGPRLPDGTRTLVLVSDDNFNPAQVTQFLIFRIRGIS
ncbi:MAG: esterase-like activity of phytase family protein [Leptolyngbyaceae cyanobacterium CRU_2_3]|nr:esterase-like activity of phytase family protein [Leptolyngbyaceae cyanobacterium CRU_2_3]